MIFRRLFLTFSLIFISSLILWSQPGDPDGDLDQQPVPIGGVELLILAGGALGARKMLKKK